MEYYIDYYVDKYPGRGRWWSQDQYLAVKTPSWHAYGVLDGHGERGELVSHRSMTILGKKFNESGDHPPNLTSLLHDVDTELGTLDHCGTTVALVVLKPVGRRLIVTIANLGDTRIVLCRDGVAERLSVDHIPTNEDERRRIEAAGGEIIDGRICGNIPTRGLGDTRAKKYISATPFVRELDLTQLDFQHSYIIIASDGIWDVITDEDAVRLTKDGDGAANVMTETLVEEARRRRSSDDITCMVIRWSKLFPWYLDEDEEDATPTDEDGGSDFLDASATSRD